MGAVMRQLFSILSAFLILLSSLPFLAISAQVNLTDTGMCNQHSLEPKPSQSPAIKNTEDFVSETSCSERSVGENIAEESNMPADEKTEDINTCTESGGEAQSENSDSDINRNAGDEKSAEVTRSSDGSNEKSSEKQQEPATNDAGLPSQSPGGSSRKGDRNDGMHSSGTKHRVLGYNAWTAKAPMPTARYGLAAVELNGIIYVIGGYTGSSYLDTVEAYSPKNNSWWNVKKMPTARAYLTAAAVNGIIYAIGGSDGSPLQTTEAYNPRNNSWWNVKNMPTARFELTAVTVNGIIYAIGGSQGPGPIVELQSVEAYNPVNNSWWTVKNMPTARYGLAAAEVNGIIYAMGGSASPRDIVEAYNPANNSWWTVKKLPTSHNYFAAAEVNGIIYALAGENNTAITSTVEAYNPANNSWWKVRNMPTAREYLAAAQHNGTIYAFGGLNGGALNIVEAYDTRVSGGAWHYRANMPTARKNLTSAEVNGVLYCIGGEDTTQYFNLTHAYSPRNNSWWNVKSMPTARAALAAAEVNGTVYALGGYGQAFDDDGVVQSNPSGSSDIPYSIAVDSDYIYIVGYDAFPGDYEWRIEKRDKRTGMLVSTFNSNGVIQSNPSSGEDVATAIAIDESYIYVAGYDYVTGNSQWRIEKRNKTTGALVTEFDTDGIVTSNPTAGSDAIMSIAVDSSYIYAAGYDAGGGYEWRIEKRDKTTGALVTAFDGDGVVVKDQSTAADAAYSIAVDSAYIYIAGYDSTPGNAQWCIEKRDKTTGALVISVQSNPSGGEDIAQSVAIDSSYLYIAGYESPSVSNTQWRIEKRYKTGLGLVSAFDGDGVVQSNPSTEDDRAYAITVDSRYLYVTGYDSLPGTNSEWRIEKRDKTTGALVTAFDSDGFVQSDPSPGNDGARAIAVDSSYLYVAGYDYIPNNDEWRIEKREITTGVLATQYLPNVEAWNPRAGTWTTVTGMPTPRYGLAAAAVDGIIYAIGGMNSSGALSKVEAYDPRNDTWWTVKKMPTARYALAAAVVDGIIYAIGGVYSGGVLSTVEAYSPKNNSWWNVRSLQTARKGLGTATIDGIIYAIGGANVAGDPLSLVEAYDTQKNSWVAAPSIPGARAYAGGCEINGVIYISGGQAPGGISSLLWAFSTRLFRCTFSVSTAPGGTPMSASNFIAVSYKAFGDPLTANIWDGMPASGPVDFGSTVIFSALSSGSCASERWSFFQDGVTYLRWTATGPVTLLVRYYHQRNMTFSVSTVAGGTPMSASNYITANYVGINTVFAVNIYDGSPATSWCDNNSQVTFSATSNNPPPNQRWVNNSALTQPTFTVTSSGTKSANYYHQYQNTINPQVAIGGNALSATNYVSLTYTTCGSPASAQLYNPFACWADKDSTLTLSGSSSGSGANERWYRDASATPWTQTVSSGGTIYIVSYYHQLTCSFSVSTGVGGVIMSATNNITVTYMQFSSTKTSDVWDGVTTGQVWVNRGNGNAFGSPQSSGSTSAQRWTYDKDGTSYPRWNILSSQTYTATYFHQLRCNFSVSTAAGGKPMNISNNITLSYNTVSTGNSITASQPLWDGNSVTLLWVNRGTSNAQFSAQSSGSTSTQRWTYASDGTGYPSWSVTNPWSSYSAVYHHQLNNTFVPTVAAGGSALSSSNTVNLRYDNGFGSYTQPVYGSISIWHANGTVIELSGTSSSSSSTVRWQRNAAGSSYTVTPQTGGNTYPVVYYHQYKPSVTFLNTNATHTVHTEARKFFGANDYVYSLHGSWSDWCDNNTVLTFSQNTTGVPKRWTTDVRSWIVSSAFSATINYNVVRYSVTVNASTAAGGIAMNSTNSITVSYISLGSLSHTYIWDAHNETILVDANTLITLSNKSSGSGSTTRWTYAYDGNTTPGWLATADGAVYSAVYTHQFYTVLSVRTIGTPGMSRSNNISATYQGNRTARTTWLWDGKTEYVWCDRNSVVSFETQSSGSNSTHRWSCAVQPHWNIVSAGVCAANYYPQFNTTLNPQVAAGGTAFSATNNLTLNYTLFGTAYNQSVTTKIWLWHDAGTALSLSGKSSSSSMSERWYRDDAGSSWSTIPNTGGACYQIVYYHQFHVTIMLKGTDAMHRAGIEARAFFGSNVSGSEHFDFWADWCDAGSSLIFSKNTTGRPPRITIDKRSWTVNSAFTASLTYNPLARPSVTILNPQPQTYITGDCKFLVTAFSPAGIHHVNLSISGLVYTMNYNATSGNYELVLRLTPDGTYTAVVIAYDIYAQSNASSVIFHVDLNPPLLNVHSPVHGSYVKGDVRLNVTATDVYLLSVDYSVDSGVWVNVSVVWNTITYADGPHQLSVRALDRAGHASYRNLTVIVYNQGTIEVIIQCVTVLPSSSIKLGLGQKVNFTAVAYDQNGKLIAGEGVTYSWTLTGGIGGLNTSLGPNVLFTATSIGNGTLNVSATYMWRTVYAEATITVVSGPQDVTGPLITATRPTGRITDRQPAIIARFSDESGINLTSVILKVDDSDVTYSSSTTLTTAGISYLPPAPMSIGTHTVYLRVADNSPNRNTAVIQWSFTIVAPTVPSAPRNLTLLAGDGFVFLRWQPPADTGGATITWYYIYRKAANEPEFHRIAVVNGTTTEYNDTSVTNGVTYFYNVSALNSVGEGKSSTTMSATPRAMMIPTGEAAISPFVWFGLFLVVLIVTLSVIAYVYTSRRAPAKIRVGVHPTPQKSISRRATGPPTPLIAQVSGRCSSCKKKITIGDSIVICGGCKRKYHTDCARSIKLCAFCSSQVTTETTVIDEVFLIYRDGRLIRHETRRLKPDMDQDILASMLVAVQSFVKDSFRGEEGGLDELKFGELKILIGRGKWLIVAAVLLGEEAEPFRPQILRLLTDLETRYGNILETWDGNMDRVSVLGTHLKDLITGKYA